MRGEPELARALADAGWTVSAASEQPIVAAEAIRCARGLPPGGLLALAPVAGRDGSGRLARLLSPRATTAALIRRSRAAAALATLARALQGDGLDVAWIETGDRSRRHRLQLVDRPRALRRPILLASRGIPSPSSAERARAAAEEAAGVPLAVRGYRVLAGGTLLAELDAPAGRLLLRVAGGSGGRLLAHSEAARRALAAAAPARVGDRLVTPIASGALAGARWTLEPEVAGVPARRVGTALHGDCLEFLVALRTTPAASLPGAHNDAAAVQPHLAGRERATLERVTRRLGERLAHVARGWCHGDFWTANLLVRDGRLAWVLDWDAAASDGLPLLDLLHLMAYADRSLRRLPHGLRCTRVLWPLTAAGGDAGIREYCAATGTPDDAGTLEALAVAYWLGRVARDLRTFADRAHRPDWMAGNVHRPLATLEAQGW
ncbi:MAG TPA: hypothetical protein VKA57_05220 [Solirubrobacteraceae bacterium]|nr:hypothetical protein [Solirubrobacteraceae bacterium]